MMVASRTGTSKKSEYEHDASKDDHKNRTALDNHRYIDDVRHFSDPGYAGEKVRECRRVRNTENTKRQKQNPTYLQQWSFVNERNFVSRR